MKVIEKFGLGSAIILLSFAIFFALETTHTTNFFEYTPPKMTGNAEIMPEGKIIVIQILKDSFEQGNPDYAPKIAVVSQGDTFQWTNEDSAIHTVTSKSDFGKTFDSGAMDAGDVYTLNTANLAVGEYEYFCVVHSWMVSTLVIEESKEGI